MKKRRIIGGKEIGAIIKKRRKELGLSQEKLAEILNISYQQVQRYENGTNKLNVDNLQVVAEILQIPVVKFFEGAKAISEKPAPVDETKLLKAYRDIKDKGSRNLVLQVARKLARN